MNTDIDRLLNNYYNWLKDKTAWKLLKDWVEITTPYLDRHNDYIQLYLKQEGDKYILTDDGYTIDDLEQSGCSLDSPRRQKLLEMTLNGFGVHKDGNQLLVKTTERDFPLNKHNLIQAVLSVNDMFYLAKPNIANLFFEDVQIWLEGEDIRFVERVPFIGHSGYTRHFDFVIPKSKNAPERMIQTVNNPTKSKADDIALGWVDTKDARPVESAPYAFINDNESKVSDNFMDALLSYDITPIPWSQKLEYRQILAA
ncbi:MAG: DUF1828 domain-containing protein [Bacteroidota bacterium]